MKSFIRYLSLTIVFTLLSGCEKPYVVSKSQDILFQMEYINHAWGYAHNGFFIDANGNILTYNLPEKWNFPADDQTITRIAMTENMDICKIADTRIQSEELHKYTNYIDNIAASKITSPKNVAADAGSLSYYCFQYSESTMSYKRILIRTEGDFISENLNFYSRRVVDWMNSIKPAIPGK